MNVRQLSDALEGNRTASLHVMLPGGEFVPDHFHVTEVGLVDKTFIDCGGIVRRSLKCSLQIWTADDVGHRLRADKLAAILRMAQPMLGSHDLPVELEYGADVAAQYQLTDIEVTPKGLLLVLAGSKTDCLARDKCGIGNGVAMGCC